MNEKITTKTVCVVGLGYVGYPLAEAFSAHIPTIGFDIDEEKIESIQNIPGNTILATSDPEDIRKADVAIIAVPTPVTKAKDPDLFFVQSAGEIVGRHLKRGATVVLESTVYPGLTESVLVPILEEASGMTCGTDFFIGYSPERINPGDDAHTLEKITKIVAGMNKEITEQLASLYGLITNVFIARDIRTAEAAKVIENVQRDLNIALMNELAIIFHRLGMDTHAVLEAAGTKWNFHSYTPGLVGGHCIPVDPYYLVMKAEEAGYHPQVILAGRAINDSMPRYVAQMAIKGLNAAGKTIKGSKVLIMGLTYKEDVPDTRESPVGEMVAELKEYFCQVYGDDPLLSDAVIRKFGAEPYHGEKMDAVIIAVAHAAFRRFSCEDILGRMNSDPVIVDVRGMMNLEGVEGVYYSRL
ncbi:nucleotide sugar dehydrogenase [Methanocalculus sp.]|uniref:nucleotide sugar dehydrogenase n=1 Tax=Methanocalculus sp. TaxID=2004547 RepID=UPI00318329BC